MGMQMTLTDPYRLMADSGVVITGADAGMSGMLRMRAADVVAWRPNGFELDPDVPMSGMVHGVSGWSNYGPGDVTFGSRCAEACREKHFPGAETAMLWWRMAHARLAKGPSLAHARVNLEFLKRLAEFNLCVGGCLDEVVDWVHDRRTEFIHE